MSGKHKKVRMALNYFEHFVIFISTVSGCVSISPFASLVGIPVGITSSAVGLKIFAITSGIKKYKSIIKNIVFLAKTMLSDMEFLISKALKIH